MDDASEVTGATVLYDGDCGACAAFAAAATRRLGDPGAVLPWQRADLDRLQVPVADARRALQWIGADGRREEGHLAVAAWLTAAGGPWRVLGAALRAPGVSAAAALAYRVVAAQRHRLPGRRRPACVSSGRDGERG